MSPRLKIGILGSKGTTLDLIAGLCRIPDVEIAKVFVLNETTATKSTVAFYEADSIRSFCEKNNIPVHELRSYNLKDPVDIEAFDKVRVDILCVLGWERLLPDYILEKVKYFTCGMHGSSYGLPRGRGRSPMNWSLITNRRHFTTSLFRYSPGTDDGDVIASRTFDINEFDTIETLHQKNRLIMQLLLAENLPKLLRGDLHFTPQPDSAPSFYPKRTPDHSGIDWSETTAAIHRLVRAVMPPYPAAFALLGDEKLYVEAAQPFDTALFAANIEPGTIVDVSISSERFVVKTVDGSLLITRISGMPFSRIRPGMVLRGVDRADEAATLKDRYGPKIPEDQWEIHPRIYRSARQD